jgi:integrase
MLDSRARLLRAALGFLSLEAREPELRLLHAWLDTWSGIGHVVAGMARQGYRLHLAEKLDRRPHIAMLKEANARQGFFEQAEFNSLLPHLPDYLRPAIEFAYTTGWRIRSEVLPLTWDRVDFAAGVVRLDVGTTKTGHGRTFVMTQTLRGLLGAQRAMVPGACPWVFPSPAGAQAARRGSRVAGWASSTRRGGRPA